MALDIDTISALPAAPSRNSATFAEDANTFVAALPGFRSQLNVFAGQANSLAAEAEANAVAAEAAQAATDSARQAAENAAAVLAFQGAYNAGTTYALGQTVSYGGVYYVSLQNANTGNTPAGGSAWWAPSFAMTIPSIALGSGWDVDLGLGVDFTRTVAGTGAFTLSNVPSSGVTPFVLEITYTSGAITFFSGFTVAWAEHLGGAQVAFQAGHIYKMAMEIRGGTTVVQVLSVVDYA